MCFLRFLEAKLPSWPAWNMTSHIDKLMTIYIYIDGFGVKNMCGSFRSDQGMYGTSGLRFGEVWSAAIAKVYWSGLV
jgi:hypothetical protein